MMMRMSFSDDVLPSPPGRCFPSDREHFGPSRPHTSDQKVVRAVGVIFLVLCGSKREHAGEAEPRVALQFQRFSGKTLHTT